MGLKALEDVVRVGARILIVEAGHIADRYLGVADAIDPCPTVLPGGERIAEGVDDLAVRDASRGNLPQLFDPEAIGLGVVGLFEVEALNKLLRAVAPCSLGKDSDLSAEVVSGL